MDAKKQQGLDPLRTFQEPCQKRRCVVRRHGCGCCKRCASVFFCLFVFQGVPTSRRLPPGIVCCALTRAEVGAKNSKGLTPLHVSCLKPNAAMARLLLLWGADANARDKKKRTPERVIGDWFWCFERCRHTLRYTHAALLFFGKGTHVMTEAAVVFWLIFVSGTSGLLSPKTVGISLILFLPTKRVSLHTYIYPYRLDGIVVSRGNFDLLKNNILPQMGKKKMHSSSRA